MGLSRHGDHLVKVTRLGSVNAYLVEDEDGITIVDTALPGSSKAISAAAEDSRGEVRRIAVTHAHGDHVGSLAALHKQFPEADLLVPARDVRFLRGDKSIDPDEPQAKPKGSLPKVDVEPSRLLEAGDRVGSLEVVPSPGHTPGHVSFLDTRDRTLIAGDAFQTLGGIAVSGTVRPLFPFPAMGNWHKPTALESARRLRALDPSRLAVGHGRVIESPAGEMDRASADAS